VPSQPTTDRRQQTHTAISRRRAAQQLQPQRALGALALGFGVRTLELEPAAVAIEDLFQRGDHHAGEPRFEAVQWRALSWNLERLGIAARPAERLHLAAAREIGHADHRIEDP
jgi:hypothetical protein